MAWANNVVGGNDEELRPDKRDVFMIKRLIPLVYHESMFPEKVSN